MNSQNTSFHSSHEEQQINFPTSIAPTPEFLQEGAKFNLENVKQHFSNKEKEFQITEIPSWLYGTWYSEEQSHKILDKNPQENKQTINKVKILEIIGDVVSTNKKIYSIAYPGIISSLRHSNGQDEYQILLLEDRRNALMSMHCYEKAIRVMVDPETQLIKQVLQTETAKVYYPNFKKNSLDSVSVSGLQQTYSREGQSLNLAEISMKKNFIQKHELLDLELITSENSQSNADSD